jgi:hypothetical protein
MSRFILMFFTVLLPGLALAKRAAPAKVEPVIHQDVRYIVPNDDGRRAYIEAWDVQTNKKLWDLTVFTNRIDPKLEEDAQHVFIKMLRVRDGTLIVISERGETYRVDLKTKAVTQSELGALRPTASLDSLPALHFRFGFCFQSHRNQSNAPASPSVHHNFIPSADGWPACCLTRDLPQSLALSGLAVYVPRIPAAPFT